MSLKPRYKLSFISKFICISLLILSYCCMSHKQAYYSTYEYGNQGAGFYYLQKGDYELKVHCKSAPSDNEIIVYSDYLINENNQNGKILAKESIGTDAGIKSIALHLERYAYHVNLKTLMDNETENYITRVELQSVQLENRDNYFLGMLFLSSAAIIFLCTCYIPAEKYREALWLIFIAVLASFPLFSGHLIDGHDLLHHSARLEAIYQGLLDGEFPVYLGSTQMGGFGTLSATMYPSLFLYPFALLRVVGVSLMLCYKLLVMFINVVSAITSYYSAKHMCKSQRIAFWVSIFFTFSVYRLTNIYHRGAVGESLALAFMPLVLWGIYEVLWGNYKKWYILCLGMICVLNSHVISVFMCAFFGIVEVIVWLVVSAKKKESYIIKRIGGGYKGNAVNLGCECFFFSSVFVL